MQKPILKIILFSFVFVSFAVPAHAAIIDYKFPCSNFGSAIGLDCPEDTSKSIPNYIKRLYQFAIGISGILAVGMMVAGGILYTVSAGSPDKQNEGKDMIFSALWGLALLFGAYIILNTINPGLVLLREPNAPQFVGTSPAEAALGKAWGWCEASKTTECVTAIQKSDNPSATGISCCLAVTQNLGKATCKTGGWGWDDTSQKSCCIKGFVVGNCTYGSGITTDAQLKEREDQIRKTLELGGVGVSSTGRCFNPKRKDCTNVGLLPESTIDSLLAIKKKCNCEVVVTGGAETGHETHGPNKPIVDLRTNQQLLNYLKNNNSNILKICTTYENRAYAKNCKNSQGEDFYETIDHIHINFK